MSIMHGCTHESMHAWRIMHTWHSMACMLIKACMALDSCMNGRKLVQVSLCQKDMTHFEQPAPLATAWANDVDVKTMALNHSIVQVSSNKKLRRSRVLSYMVLAWHCLAQELFFKTRWFLCASNFQLGDLKRNAAAIGLAVKHCSLQPSLVMFKQAALDFFALALPRGKDVCRN